MKKLNLKWLWKWFIPTDSKNEEPQIPTTISQEQGEDKLHIKDEMPEFLKQTLDEDSIQKWDYSVADADKTVCQKRTKVVKAVINGTNETEIQYDTDKPSLLNNKPLVKIFAECADLLKDLDDLVGSFKSEREQFLLQMVREKIRTILLLSGGTLIDNDESFDIIRHISINCDNAVNGMPIQKVAESGIMLEDRVFVRAKVILKI